MCVVEKAHISSFFVTGIHRNITNVTKKRFEYWLILQLIAVIVWLLV